MSQCGGHEHMPHTSPGYRPATLLLRYSIHDAKRDCFY